MPHIKIYSTLILILAEVTCFSQQNGKHLLHAYKNKSVTELFQFYENWNKEIPAIGNQEYSKLNDTLKEVYNVFTAFYQPLNIRSLGGSEWGNEIYNKVTYLIVQNSVKIYVTNKIYHSTEEIDSLVVKSINGANINDSVKLELLKRKNNKLSPHVIERFDPFGSFYDRKDSLIKQIKNFRPRISVQNKKTLYLIPKYDILLNAFLGNTHLPLGSGGIMNPARTKGESAKRQKFLEHFIKIWYGHWGGYWQLYSYPTATSIVFDKDMRYAQVNFRFVYEGGEAILKNNKGKWELLSSKRTWIE